MKAILLTIGNEVLNGQVIDTNAAWMAQELLALGVPVLEKWSVGDQMDSIISAMDHSLKRAEIVIMTGGLGPTTDDLTCEAISRYLQKPRIFHEATYQRIEDLFKKLGRSPGPSHLEQARLPEGVLLLPNSAGTAPGMYFELSGKHLISMPGVPYEMKAIFHPHLANLLNSIIKGPKRYSHTLHTGGEGETFLEDKIRNVLDHAPKNISFAFLPDIFKVRIRIDLDTEDEAKDMPVWRNIIDKIKSELKNYLIGEQDLILEKNIGLYLKSKNWTLGLAESCTGGNIAHLITSISGSSDYFKGSVVAYSNEIKMNLLNVPASTLKDHGAVSEETAFAMADGALSSLGVQIAVAVTGIAGPHGGTEEKPVGLVWIAIASVDGRKYSKKLQLIRNRLLNIQAASNMALILLFRFLQESTSE